MGVRSLGYIRLDSTEIEQWRTFGSEILGLMPVDGSDPESLYFRMDTHPPRLVVSPAAESRLTGVGFEVNTPKALEAVVAAVEATGTKVVHGSVEECENRRVTGFASFPDPGGTPLEVFYGPVLDHVRVQTPLVSGFVTGPDMGMGHVVVSSADAQASYDFYTEVLGFQERNTMETPMGKMWFLSPNHRHHTIGIIQKDGPVELFHFMLETADIDDVGLALDRIAEHEVPLQLTLGKHTNDHMISFYVYTPDRFAVEYGWAGIQVPEPEPTYAITATSFWGHKFQGPPPN